MKATEIFPPCRPARSGAASPSATRAGPINIPVRRSVPSRIEPLAPPGAASLPDTAPHVLNIDSDAGSAQALAALLTPEARVTHVATLAAARAVLQRQIFAAVVIDPRLPDGDAGELLPVLNGIPLLVYSAQQPDWRTRSGVYLPKPWTSPRQLWSTIARLLGIPTPACAGD